MISGDSSVMWSARLMVDVLHLGDFLDSRAVAGLQQFTPAEAANSPDSEITLPWLQLQVLGIASG